MTAEQMHIFQLSFIKNQDSFKHKCLFMLLNILDQQNILQALKTQQNFHSFVLS